MFHFFSASSPISTAISLGVLHFVFRFGGLYVDTVELREQVLETLTKDLIYQEEREKERENRDERDEEVAATIQEPIQTQDKLARRRAQLMAAQGIQASAPLQDVETKTFKQQLGAEFSR